jgi:hypothetical protein
MALVNLLDVQVLDNPAPFNNPFQFEITFECAAQLEDGMYFACHTTLRVWFVHTPSSFFTDLEWKIIYVGSAESETYDQELDNIMVGPVPVGVNKFVFQVMSWRFQQRDGGVFSLESRGVLWTLSLLDHFLIAVFSGKWPGCVKDPA